MVLLSSPRTITIDGVTVFPDHADPDQFWYLPAPVALARRGPAQDAQFTLVLFKGATPGATVAGGGFLMFEAGLQLDPATERKILARLSSLARKPRLTIVPFEEGTVECIALNLQGSGGTTGGQDAPGTFSGVQMILGAKSPSLHGAQSAAFSLRLNQDAAIILREAFQKEGAPVGVLYALKFTGLQPAMEVTITADMKRVYEHFSAGLSANVYFISAGVEVGLEKLKEDKAIDIKVTHFTTDADRAQKEQQALQYFKELVLQSFFTPALTPGQLMGGGATPPTGGGGTQPGGGGTQPGGGGTQPGGGGTQPGGGTDPGGGGTQPGGGGTQPGGGTDPGGGGTQPGGGGTQPGGGGTQPGGGTDPGGGGTQPGGGGTQPGGGGTQPGGGGTLPAGGGTDPGAGGTQPGAAGGVQPGDGGTQPGGAVTPAGGSVASALRVSASAPHADPVGGMGGGVGPGLPVGPGGGGVTPPVGGGTDPGAGGAGGGTTGGGGGTPPTGAAGGSPISISFKLKFIKQEELKTAVLHYQSQQAVQRSYNPQGFIGLMTKDLDKAKHFIEVDLDAPFFRQMAVTVDAPIDFAKIGLHSAQIALDYGDPADPSSHRHKDMVFDTQHTGEQGWDFFLNRTLDMDFAYRVQYHFDPASGWEGEALSYDLGVRRGEDRTLYVNPFEHLRFSEYTVAPRGIDFGVVDFSEVLLRYDPPGRAPVQKTVILRPNGEPQVWKLRTPVATVPLIRYRATHHLKDGSTREGVEATTERTAILVDDPFPDALQVMFFPFFDAAQVRKVFVDVEYKDPDNAYERKERLEIPGTAVDEVPFRIALIDGSKRKFRYQLTFVKMTGIVQKPSVETDQTIISVSE